MNYCDPVLFMRNCVITYEIQTAEQDAKTVDFDNFKRLYNNFLLQATQNRLTLPNKQMTRLLVKLSVAAW